MREMSDHTKGVTLLRERAERTRQAIRIRPSVTMSAAAYAELSDLLADLLEIHDATGISLDNWLAARSAVERAIGHRITENGA